MSEQINSLRQSLRQAAGTRRSAQSMPVSRVAVAASDGLLSRLLKKPATWVRRHERFACCVVAVLDVSDKNVPVDGLITEISQGGLLFRPASSFIFDRRGSPVTVRFGDDEIEGEIVNVKSSGYGVRFHHEIAAEQVTRLLDSFGLSADTEAA
jgi:hypothetical protein